MKMNTTRFLVTAAMAFIVTSTSALASETDDRIETSFKESYVFKTHLKNDTVKAKANEGVVTLTGTVDQQSHKGLAEETASNLPGVTSVDNRLELKAEYPANKSNEWLAMNIKAALLYYKNVSASNTEVHVEEGIVTLRGEAANEAQKELTAEYANIEGVREIRNEMTVAKEPKTDQTMKEKIDDASITAQVKIALLTHRGTSVLKTSVTTKDGVVTLTGKAENAAEKALATKLVGDIYGVKSAVNNMTVNPPAKN